MGANNGEPESVGDDVAPSDELATIAARVFARIVDWLILFAVLALISASYAEQLEDGAARLPAWAAVLGILIVLAYETVLVASGGQTLGKRLIGIEIVSMKSATTPTVGQSILRVAPVGAAMALFSSWFPVAMVVVYFSAGFLSERRGILDRFAGTAVIRARNGGGLVGQTGAADPIRPR